MEITTARLARITRALRTIIPRMNASQFAEALDRHPSWASRLLNGQITNIPDAIAIQIEELLGITIGELPLFSTPATLTESPTAQDDTYNTSRVLEETPTKVEPPNAQYAFNHPANPNNKAHLDKIRDLISQLENQISSQHTTELPWFSSKELTKIGGEITRIVFREEGKFGAIGRQVVELLSNISAQKQKHDPSSTHDDK